MNINAESATPAEKRLLPALNRLDEAVKERRCLVGESYSRADWAACALLNESGCRTIQRGTVIS